MHYNVLIVVLLKKIKFGLHCYGSDLSTSTTRLTADRRFLLHSRQTKMNIFRPHH